MAVPIYSPPIRPKLGEVALRSLNGYAPDPETPGRRFRYQMDPPLAQKIYQRIVDKLKREPVEDFRLDFEDGYGNRPDEEEDRHAQSSAVEVAEACANRPCRRSSASGSSH